MTDVTIGSSDVSTILGWLPAAPDWDPTNEEYHATTEWWGSTMIKDYRHSPGLAYRRYIAKDLPRDPPTAPMILGSLVHIAVIEPETWDDQVWMVDTGSKNANIYKNAVADNPKMMVVLRKEADAAREMADSILEPQTEDARLAKALLVDLPGYSEYSYRWKDELGVPCKVRFDRLCETDRGPARVNLKTSIDASTEGFSRQAYNFDYHAAEALYERGFFRLTGEEGDGLFVVLHNQPPYEVSVKQMSEEFLDLGRRQIWGDLAELGEDLKDQTRETWCASWETGIETMDPPNWARIKAPRTFDTF